MIRILLSFFLFIQFTFSVAQNDSLRRVSNNWKSKGNFFVVQKKFSQAFQAYHRAIDLDSTNGIAYYKMYRAYKGLNNDSALYYLQKSFLYTPFLHDTLVLELSHYHLNHGNYALAKKYLQKYNKLHDSENLHHYEIRQNFNLMDSNFRKRTTIFYPISSYQKQLEPIIPFLIKTRFKCVIKSYYTKHKDSYKDISESKKSSTLIQQYLIKKGVSKSNIKVINYGKAKTLVEPKDPLASTYNNRVEIEILW